MVLRAPDVDIEALRAAVVRIGYELRDLAQQQLPEDDGADGQEAAAERSWLRRVLIAWPLALATMYLAFWPPPFLEQGSAR